MTTPLPSVACVPAPDAGVALAEHWLAHRRARGFAWLVRGLPRRWGCHLLLAALRRDADAFAGGGRLTTRCGDLTVITLRGRPTDDGARAAVAACADCRTAFEHLFRRLVHPATRVDEMSCEGRGDDACRFVLSWPRDAGGARSAT